MRKWNVIYQETNRKQSSLTVVHIYLPDLVHVCAVMNHWIGKKITGALMCVTVISWDVFITKADKNCSKGFLHLNFTPAWHDLYNPQWLYSFEELNDLFLSLRLPLITVLVIIDVIETVVSVETAVSYRNLTKPKTDFFFTPGKLW